MELTKVLPKMPQFNQTHTVYHLRKDCYVDLLVRRTIEHVGVLSSNFHKIYT